MRAAPSSVGLLALFLLSTSHAQLIPFLTNTKPHPANRADRQLSPAQQPMANNPAIQLPPSNPPNNNDNDDDNSRPTGDIILSDVLSTQPSIQIFAGLIQDIASISTRLEAPLLNTTILAPLNRAITSLPRKPWEDPREYGALGASAYSGAEGEDRAHANLRRFTEAHVVPVSPWEEGEKVQTVGGGTVWWEKKEGGDGQGETRIVQPGNVEVQAVVSRVANGEIWVVKEVLNYV